MGSTRLARAVAFVLIACSPLTGSAARGASNAEIDRSLVRAKEYLYGQQRDGVWEKSSTRGSVESNNNVEGAQWGGQTALAVYALLASGDSPQDPRLLPAIDFLKKADLVGVYALAMRAQVWLLLPRTAETRALLKKDADALRAIMRKDGKHRGLFDYVATGPTYSLSRSQYGVLGMWAAAQGGAEVSKDFWKIVEDAWIAKQLPDGGWQYKD